MRTEQVAFREEGADTIFGGILIDDKYLICECCGGVYDVENDFVSIVHRFNEWNSLDVLGDWYYEGDEE